MCNSTKTQRAVYLAQENAPCSAGASQLSVEYPHVSRLGLGLGLAKGGASATQLFPAGELTANCASTRGKNSSSVLGKN